MTMPDDSIDQLTRALPAVQGVVSREPFAIVLTLDGYLQLVARLEALERAPYPEGLPVPAAKRDDTDAKLVDAALIDLDQRLQRHRTDIDALKRWGNELLQVLRPYLGAATPTGPLETAPAQEEGV